MNKEERPTRWHAICREYREGCETQKAYCRSRGIAVSTLQYWLNKTGGEREKPSGSEVDLRFEREQLTEILKAAASL